MAKARLEHAEIQEQDRDDIEAQLSSEEDAYAAHDRAHRLGVLGARVGWKVGVCGEEAYKSWGLSGPGECRGDRESWCARKKCPTFLD